MRIDEFIKLNVHKLKTKYDNIENGCSKLYTLMQIMLSILSGQYPEMKMNCVRGFSVFPLPFWG